jgi:hypothetical protein
MSAPLDLEVVTGRERVGCKGPGAEAWLASQGIQVPAGANRFAIDAAGVFAARLATSEFLLESTDKSANAALAPVRKALERAEYPRGVYPVLRQDFVLEIVGAEAPDMFLQTCAVDLAPIAAESSASEGPIVMTSMIGVSVVLACRQLPRGPRFTVWTDPSYSHYFYSQLRAIGGVPS